MTTIQNFHNQNINSLKFPNQNVFSTIQNFLNQNVYSKKMPQTTCLLCKTVTYLLGLLVDQSSVARLDLYGEHLGGRHPAGLVPGSYSSDTQDEVSVIVLFSVLCIARFKSFCARCPFYFSRDIVPARCWPNSEEVFSKFEATMFGDHIQCSPWLLWWPLARWPPCWTSPPPQSLCVRVSRCASVPCRPCAFSHPRLWAPTPSVSQLTFESGDHSDGPFLNILQQVPVLLTQRCPSLDRKLEVWPYVLPM